MARFKVAAYRTVRLEMVVEAEDIDTALNKAESYEMVADEWREDPDSFSFNIDSCYKVEDEDDDG